MKFSSLFKSPPSRIPWNHLVKNEYVEVKRSFPEHLLKWPGLKEKLSFQEAVRGIQIFGATGSGKTSGSGAFIAQNLLSKGLGGLVLTSKKDDFELWKKYSESTSRADSLVSINWKSGHKINIFEYFRKMSETPENIHLEIADMFKEFIFNSNLQENENFWSKARDQLLINLIKVLIHDNKEITLNNLSLLLIDLYKMKSKSKEENYLSKVIDKDPNLSSYFKEKLLSLGDESFSSVVLTLEVQIGRFQNSKIEKMFMSETTFDPRIIISGAVVLIDTPMERYGDQGLLSNKLWKAVFEKTILKEKSNSSNYTFKWEDEAHNFVSKRDAYFNSTSRDKNQINIYCTQGVNNYLLDSSRSSEKSVQSLLMNLGTKIFHQTSEKKTMDLAKSIFGVKDVEKIRIHKDKNGNESSSSEKFKEDTVREETLLKLKKGGNSSRFIVEGIISQSGDEVNPLKVVFYQKAGGRKATFDLDSSLSNTL